MNVIEVKNLTKVYSPKKNPVAALKGISFEVRRGEIFGLLGVNGAGKSTTLNILIGLLTPTSGTVKILGKNFFTNEEEIKSQMNIATTYAELANNLTVYQNLKVYSLLYNVINFQGKIAKLLEKFGAANLRNQKIYELSAGEKTRVNLCKALLNDPQVLLLDEPTASLDPSMAARTRELLSHFQKDQNMTIVFTSHNMAEVEQMCQRVAFLHDGKIYHIDTPENFAKSHGVPGLEQIFIKLARGEE